MLRAKLGETQNVNLDAGGMDDNAVWCANASALLFFDNDVFDGTYLSIDELGFAYLLVVVVHVDELAVSSNTLTNDVAFGPRDRLGNTVTFSRTARRALPVGAWRGLAHTSEDEST